jgi:hypothetical protein
MNTFSYEQKTEFIAHRPVVQEMLKKNALDSNLNLQEEMKHHPKCQSYEYTLLMM